MDNLIELVGQHITPDIVQKTSAMTGERNEATQSAIHSMLPILVGAFANKGANESGAKKVMDWVAAQGESDEFINGFSSMLDYDDSSSWVMETGDALVSWLMGSKAGDGAGMVSSMAGIGGGSSSKLMSIIAPLALAVIGKKAHGSGMGTGGVASMFLSQKGFIESAAPSGLLGLLGLKSFDELGKPSTSFATTTTTTTTRSVGGMRRQGASTQGVSTQGVSTQGVSTQGVSKSAFAADADSAGTIATSGADASTEDYRSSGVSMPSISTPNVVTDESSSAMAAANFDTSAPSSPEETMKMTDVEIPRASVAAETLVDEKSRFTKVETDKRNYAYESGRPEASVDTSTTRTMAPVDVRNSATSRAASGRTITDDQSVKEVITETVPEVVTEEGPLFNRVWNDKRDIPWGNFAGRWFGWTVVVAAISIGLLFLLDALEPFLGMFMGS